MITTKYEEENISVAWSKTVKDNFIRLSRFFQILIQKYLQLIEKYLQKQYVNCTGEYRKTTSKDTEIKEVNGKQALGKWQLRISKALLSFYYQFNGVIQGKEVNLSHIH